MKIRSGFVSNSSSSSFIVRFPKDPSNIDNLREMMGDCSPNCGYNWMSCPTTEQVIERVHREITSDKTGGFESFYENNVYDRYEYQDIYNNHPTMKNAYEGRLWYDLTHEESTAITRMWLWEEYKSKYPADEPDVFVRHFTFSDECGDFESQLEHGQIFRNIPHDYTSHH